jgi:cation diffusion facilitator CzcD-associated flavoprotein CzcO
VTKDRVDSQGVSDTVDVLIIGAGVSGIGAAYHLQTRCPDKTYLILERRERIGGTWDLFRYPGIRSDSDMFTFGFRFRPWRDTRSLADGPSIREYVEETAREHGIDRHIRYQHHVVKTAWSSADATWTVTVQRKDTGETVVLRSWFLFMCTGYYDYDEGYTPELPGIDRFEGQVVHPQKWSDDIEYGGKRVVVIGSGATAVTLVPNLARRAAHVTMLQRSPTYILSVPSEDRIAKWLQRLLPAHLAYMLTRWKNILLAMAIYTASRRLPKRMRRLLIGGAKKELGEDCDVETHFNPRYDPWDQRLCLVPDADLFVAIREGRASVVTDHIDTFTEQGIRLRSGDVLEADLVVTATGLKLCFLADIQLLVDGVAVDSSELWTYKAMMFSDVPNLALWFGYTNASWTLKADLTSEYICRLINHMDRKGYRRCAPRATDADLEPLPLVGLQSGYIERAGDILPKQGSRRPWRLYENYLLDVLTIRFSRIDDGAMEFA